MLAEEFDDETDADHRVHHVGERVLPLDADRVLDADLAGGVGVGVGVVPFVWPRVEVVVLDRPIVVAEHVGDGVELGQVEDSPGP